MKVLQAIMLQLICIVTIGQNQIEIGDNLYKADMSQICDEDWLYSIVDIMPSYEGGNDRLEKDLNSKFQLGKKVNGYVIIWFNINCDDKAFGYQCIKGDKELGNKIIQEMELLDNWKSGEQRSKKVDCSFFLHIRLKKGKLIILS